MNRAILRTAVHRGAQVTVARLFPSAVILAYHRVATPSLDPQLLCVSPERFDAHLQVVRQMGVCVSLRDLVQFNAAGRLPGRAIAVTFDDGYADNYTVAEPLLRSSGVPATVFVSTGGLNDGSPFWWDLLETLLLRTEDLPAMVTLTTRGRQYEWALSAGHGESMRSAVDTAKWDVSQTTAPSPRHVAYREIAKLCRWLGPQERQIVLDDLIAQIGEQPSMAEHQRLTPREVAELDASAVVEIGAHGVTHTPLSVLSPEHQSQELSLSKRELEDMTGRAVDLLSYPFGAPGDLSDDSGDTARACGYVAACANHAGLMWRHSDPYTLPRFLVRDWDAQSFANRLKAWFQGFTWK